MKQYIRFWSLAGHHVICVKLDAMDENYNAHSGLDMRASHDSHLLEDTHIWN